MLQVPKKNQRSETNWWSLILLSGMIFAVLVASLTDVHAAEQILRVKTSDPAATTPLLSAPHTGKNICDIPDSTRVKFIRRSDHGPHKFASVQVLDGDCAGQDGYVGWSYLDPEPQEN